MGTPTNTEENNTMKNMLQRIIVQRRTNAGSGWYPQWERNVVTRRGNHTTSVGTIYGPNDDGQFHLGLTFPDGERDVYNRLNAGFGGGFDTIKSAKQAIADYYEADLRFIRVGNTSI